ncbi:MAG: hypothetical protein V7765_18120 [Oleispira sp.]
MKNNQFSKLLASSAILGSALFSGNVFAVGTEAGTAISNTATVNFKRSDGTQATPVTADASFNVDEIININSTAPSSDITTNAGDTAAVINSYTVTNLGNANESVTLTAAHAASSDFTPTGKNIYFQRSNAADNTDKLDPSDTLYAAGDIISLAKDEILTVYVTYDIPETALNTQTATINFTASSTTPGASSASLGTVLAGQGTVGSNNEAIDAVVIQGEDDAIATYIIDLDSNSLQVTINKVIVGNAASGTVTNSANVSSATTAFVPGAEVTYLIVVTVENGTATDLTISDVIPQNMNYKGSSVKMKSEVGGVIASTTTDFSTFTRPLSGTFSEPTDKQTGTISVDFGNKADGDYAIVLTAIIDN